MKTEKNRTDVEAITITVGKIHPVDEQPFKSSEFNLF